MGERGKADQDRKRPSDCSNAMKRARTAQYMASVRRVSGEGVCANALYVE